MGPYLCIFSEDEEDELGACGVGHYSDFGYFRDTIARPMKADDFSVLMTHSDSGGEWTVDQFLSAARDFIMLRLLPMKILTTLLALAMIAASTFAADGPIRHVVHFKFKADASKEQIAKIVEEFAALKGRIPVVESLEWGTNVSTEGLDKGYDHCWIVTFKNAADRDAYIVHPAHKAFVELLKPSLEEALVVDFVPQK